MTTETRVVLVCSERGVHWFEHEAAPGCVDATHEHHRIEVHRHLDRVELGCLGGHGRTGTALACLAVLSGVPAPDATAWVRSAYCNEAVETPEQEAFVRAVAPTDG